MYLRRKQKKGYLRRVKNRFCKITFLFEIKMAKEKKGTVRQKNQIVTGSLIGVCKRAQRKKSRKRTRNDNELYNEFAQNPYKKMATEAIYSATNNKEPTVLQKLGILRTSMNNVGHARMQLRVESEKIKPSSRIIRGFANLFTALSSYQAQLEKHDTIETLSKAATTVMVDELMRISSAMDEAHTCVKKTMETVNHMGAQVELMEKTLYMSESVLLEKLAQKHDRSYSIMTSVHSLFGNSPATNNAFVGGRSLHRLGNAKK